MNSLFYEEDAIIGALGAMFTMVPAMALSIAAYVLSSLGLYTVAKRRGLSKPWLAWIPVANMWLIGSLSDQYRYVARGENKSKRKVLLTLSIVMMVLWVAAMAVIISAMVLAAQISMLGSMYSSWEMEEKLMNYFMVLMGLMLPMLAVAIALIVVRYMAMFDIYKSMDPENCVLFLVLSILFNVTEPFFLFFNRNKDLGMPPRVETQSIPQNTWRPVQNNQDPWNQ